jgi:hypothetical protein
MGHAHTQMGRGGGCTCKWRVGACMQTRGEGAHMNRRGCVYMNREGGGTHNGAAAHTNGEGGGCTWWGGCAHTHLPLHACKCAPPPLSHACPLPIHVCTPFLSVCTSSLPVCALPHCVCPSLIMYAPPPLPFVCVRPSPPPLMERMGGSGWAPPLHNHFHANSHVQ